MVQPVHGFQSWFLDVGQGDGVFLRTRDEAILSDCGSSQDKKIGKNVLGPFLKSQGIRTLTGFWSAMRMRITRTGSSGF